MKHTFSVHANLSGKIWFVYSVVSNQEPMSHLERYVQYHSLTYNSQPKGEASFPHDIGTGDYVVAAVGVLNSLNTHSIKAKIDGAKGGAV